MLKEGGISVMIGFAVIVGAFIGVVITWQTLSWGPRVQVSPR
jgi:putative ABC transport system permease protein